MARENSAIVPLARRWATLETSITECAIMPGSTSATVIDSIATATKMSASAVISALCWAGRLLTASR